ncbi:MAG: hypothetical protein RIS34_1679 [Pseudomonadota bacterium]
MVKAKDKLSHAAWLCPGVSLHFLNRNVLQNAKLPSHGEIGLKE